LTAGDFTSNGSGMPMPLADIQYKSPSAAAVRTERDPRQRRPFTHIYGNM